MIKKITVRGLVQGIGFRPFIAELAEKLNIRGKVLNRAGIVEVYIEADDFKTNDFITRIQDEAPAGSLISDIFFEPASEAELEGIDKFSIVSSDPQKDKIIPVIPCDLPTCEKCQAEFFDNKNRRFMHPFISCTACGPRYSIIDRIPYDRDTISMAKFDLCPKCHDEYIKRGDRRRHAQTIACKECGPKLKLKIYENGKFEEKEENLLDETVKLLKNNEIVALKDIGGYHLVCNPFNEETVAHLRSIKHREKKPFAVMFYDDASIFKYCDCSDMEIEALKSVERPIVLIKSKLKFANNVCSGSPLVGAMLPCNPIQLYLTRMVGPLVMTSANGTGDFLITDDEEMEDFAVRQNQRLAILSNDRPIRTPLDDSIERVIAKKIVHIRRGRGITPLPLLFKHGSPFSLDESIFAAGGDLKSSFAFVEGSGVYLSQHLGDLENLSCMNQYGIEAKRMKNLFGFEPKTVTCDLHPSYCSVRLVESENFLKETKINAFCTTKIQHHKAHVASVVCEHNLKGKVIGFAFDGTGYGEDKTIWGSEAFYWENCQDREQKNMAHVASIAPMKLIGGDEGAKNCDTILYGYISNMPSETKKKFLPLIDSDRFKIVDTAISFGINTIASSSMGRLFDAVAALLNLCHYNSYEGEAAVAVENAALKARKSPPFQIKTYYDSKSERIFLNTESLLRDILEEIEKGSSVNEISLGFIEAIASFVTEVAEIYSDASIVLSGGTFNNSILTEKLINDFEKQNRRVYIPEELPCGDGGICLGQAYLSKSQR